MDTQAIWQCEAAFWTAGEAWFRANLDPACLMAFPPPTGVLTAAAAIRSLRTAPRWQSVTMTERSQAQPNDDLLVLAYQARAERDGGAYAAVCTSCYRATPTGWRLIQHQQTPIG